MTLPNKKFEDVPMNFNLFYLTLPLSQPFLDTQYKLYIFNKYIYVHVHVYVYIGRLKGYSYIYIYIYPNKLQFA